MNIDDGLSFDLKTEEEIYDRLKNEIENFVGVFKYLDYINEKRFGSKEAYETFLNTVDLLKTNGIAIIDEDGGLKTLGLGVNVREKLKNTFKDVESIKELVMKINEIRNYFIGYEFETFFDKCKFVITFPNGGLELYLPDNSPIELDKKIEKIIINGRKEEVVKSIFQILDIYNIRLEAIKEIESAFSLIKNKYRKAEKRFPEIVERFFENLLKTVERIFNEEKYLLAYDNAVCLDEKNGILAISKDTVYNILKKVREEDKVKGSIYGLMKKIGAPYREKELVGKVITVFGDMRVSKKIFEIKYTRGFISIFDKIITPLIRKVEENKDMISIFSDDVKEVILE